MLPPYNEHLMRDVGALNLATALVLAVAALNLEHFPAGDAVAQTAALAVGVLVPAALLVLTRRRVTP
jgi:hypothetical protein